MSKFVHGVNHQEILDTLIDHLDALSRGEQRPRVILLKGNSGLGKTRIIRELYRHLQKREAERASRPAFWPELPENPNSKRTALDPMPSRKVLGPRIDNFEWAENALPTFGWWTFDCTLTKSGEEGDGLDVITARKPTLTTLHLPLAMGVRDAKGELKALLDFVRDKGLGMLRREASDYGLVLLTAGFAALGVPSIPGVASRTWNMAWGELLRHQDVRSTVHLTGNDERDGGVTAFAQRIVEVAHPKVPGVVLIEDLHDMEKPMDQFLDILKSSSQKHPVLVIGTIWPEAVDKAGFKQWAQGLVEGKDVLTLELKRLGQEGQLEILNQVAPATRREVGERLVARYETPLDLALLFSTVRFQNLLIKTDGGALALETSDAQLRALPRDRNSLLLAQWAELPTQVRDALMQAAVGLKVDPGFSAGFGQEIMVEAARRAGLINSDLMEGYERARGEYAWSTSAKGLPDGWDRFSDTAYVEFAAQQFQDAYFERDQPLWASTAEVLREWIEHQAWDVNLLDPFDPLSDQVVSWLLRLAPEAEDRRADTVVRLYEAYSSFCANGGDADKALAILPPNWIDHVGAMELRDWLAESQDFDFGPLVFDRLRRDQENLLARAADDAQRQSHSLALMEARHMLARMLLDEIEAIYPSPEEALARGHAWTTPTVGQEEVQDRKTEHMVTEFRRLAEDCFVTLGDHPFTSEVMRGTATVLRRFAGITEATTIAEESLRISRAIPKCFFGQADSAVLLASLLEGRARSLAARKAKGAASSYNAEVDDDLLEDLYRRALELSSEAVEDYKGLSILRRSEALEIRGRVLMGAFTGQDFSQARDMFAKAIDIVEFINERTLYKRQVLLADATSRAGEHDEALRILDGTLAASSGRYFNMFRGEYLRASVLRAEVLERSGDYGEAGNAFRELEEVSDLSQLDVNLFYAVRRGSRRVSQRW